jgi:hypothetical protein
MSHSGSPEHESSGVQVIEVCKDPAADRLLAPIVAELIERIGASLTVSEADADNPDYAAKLDLCGEWIYLMYVEQSGNLRVERRRGWYEVPLADPDPSPWTSWRPTSNSLGRRSATGGRLGGRGW